MVKVVLINHGKVNFICKEILEAESIDEASIQKLLEISNTDFNQLIHNLNSNRLILIFICISY